MELFIVGITGAAGSGKSEVSRVFQELGAFVIDADDIARSIATSEEVLSKLQSALGPEHWQRVVQEDGSIDRKALRRLISEDGQAQQILNSITHPLIAERIASMLLHAADSSKSGIAAVEAALIFGSGFEQMFDRIILVSAPIEKCQMRIATRDGVSLDDAAKLLMAQGKTLKLALSGADLVIENSGSLEELREKAVDTWKEIELLARDKRGRM